MADLPQTEPTPGLRAAEESDRSEIRQQVTRLRISNVALMIPITVFTGFVSLAALSATSQMLARTFHLRRPGAISGNLILIIGITSGVLTMVYFLLQLDEAFATARLQGRLEIHRPGRCPSCRALLIVGQLICEGCGADLRSAQVFHQPPRRLRRQMLHSYVLGTVPLAHLVFTITAMVIGVVWDFQDVVFLTIAIAVTGLFVALRLPHAIELWRLLDAEDIES